jgi:diaminopimelate decarboxylase
MTFDSISELEKISPDSDAQLIIRIRVDDSQSTCRLGSKFGCRLTELDDIYEFAKKAKYKLTGVNFHVGSNCLDPETYHKAIKDARFALDKAKDYGFKFDTLDIGGGFPSDTELFASIAQTVNFSLDTYFKDIPNIIAEPGRYLVEKSHTLVVSVITVKSDRRYYINEGLYGSFNCVYFDHAYPVFVPYTLKSDNVLYKKSTVFGPTCDSMDVLGDSYLLPDLSVGDRLYVENFGAYTCAASSNFNGFNAPTRYYIIKTLV